MRIAACVAVALVCLCIAGATLAESRPYVVLGPEETADFERGLYELQPGYVLGVGLSEARWQTGELAKDLSPADAERLAHYQESIAAWLNVILQPELQPAPSAKTEWPLFRRLHWNVNYICGRYQSQSAEGPYRNALVHFKSTSFYLTVTVTSETLFPAPAATMSDEEVIQAVAKVVRIPLERDISVVKRVDTVAGRHLCHGKIWIDWNEKAYHENVFKQGRQWWSVITFSYVQGRMHLSVCTWDFTRHPPRSANKGWRFTEDSARWSTTRPGIPPRKFPVRKTPSAADLYVPQGATETADFERGLYALNPVYAAGVPLSAERWAMGLTQEDLSPDDAERFAQYHSTIAGWLDEMLRPELKPAPETGNSEWRVLPGLSSKDTDLIVGRWTAPAAEGPYAGASVELRASRQQMYVTVASEALFSLPVKVGSVSTSDIIDTVTKVLRPPPTRRKPAIPLQVTTVAGRTVCHGGLTYDWHRTLEADPDKLKTRKWWSRIDFWFTQGRAFVSVSTWTWAAGPPAESESASWPISGGELMRELELVIDEHDPNMTKVGPKLSADELASIARLSIPELAGMLKRGDSMHAYAALDQLTADGGRKDNFDLLLSIAYECRGDMIVEALVKTPVSKSAGEDDKRRLDRFLDFLELQLADDRPSVSRPQAVRSIAKTVYFPRVVLDKVCVPSPGRGGATQPADKPAKPELPYAYERVVGILTDAMDHQEWQARRAAIRWLGTIGGSDPSKVDDIVALLEAKLAAEEARDEEERIKASLRRTVEHSLRQLRRGGRNANPGMRSADPLPSAP